MKIISLINSKGGVGKTTLATNLARYLYIYSSMEKDCKNDKVINNGKGRVLLVDADPQGSVRGWDLVGCQTEVNVICCDTRQTLLRLPAYLKENSFDYVVIDTPGNAQEITGSAIAISDLCLIPVQPSCYDLWASNDVVDLIKARHTVTDGKPDVFYVLNLCITNTKVNYEVREFLDQGDIKLIGKPIHRRLVYSATAKQGKTVFDATIDQAIDEINQLGEQIIWHFKEQK